MNKPATVLGALQRLNWLYGRGDIRELRRFADGRCYFIAQLQYGTVKRQYRVEGRTVYACGHQCTMAKGE